MRIYLFAFQWSSRSLDSSPMSFFPDFVIAYHKISIEKFSYFMTPCHQHSLCISSLFSDSMLFPPSPIPHGFQKGATRLIAYGEIEDVAHNVGGFAHGLDAVDAHRPSAVVLIEVSYAHILLQISQDASESRRLIVGRIFRRNEKHCHVPLLQHDFSMPRRRASLRNVTTRINSRAWSGIAPKRSSSRLQKASTSSCRSMLSSSWYRSMRSLS